MRGQKLFIRPIDASDHDAIRAFLHRYAPGIAVPGMGLIGKLVGNLVSVLAMSLTSEALRVDCLVVSEELRRKHIGRFMMDEAVRMAAKLEKGWVECNGERGFLERVGFAEEGGVMRRKAGE